MKPGIVVLAIALAVVLLLAVRPRIARAEMLKEGQPAPDFSTDMVQGADVKPVKLSDFKGQKVLLYFYPKDGTSGCTKEACSLRDGYARLTKAGVQVLGCSTDSADSHKDFIAKNQLPFALLLDPGKKIAKAYGAANGIPILGYNRRVSYLIDENGTILKAYPQVDPATHAAEILRALGIDSPPPA